MQLVALNFGTQTNFGLEDISVYARDVSIVCGFIYVFDMTLRVVALWTAMLPSTSSLLDLFFVVLMVAILICRFCFISQEFALTSVYMVLAAGRLMLKPRARTYSKKLHRLQSQQHRIRVSIESVKSALTRIPGMTPVSIEMLETDLIIICGKDEGDLTQQQLMQFLERALFYRPKELSATEFLSYLRDIDAKSTRSTYGAIDVVKSTLGHWSNQKFDLSCTIFVVCLNACANPLLAYFISYISNNAFPSSTSSGSTTDLRIGVIGILCICIPFVVGDYGVGYFQSKMISKATERMQKTMTDIILHQNTYFFSERSEGDLNNLFSSDIARVNALWQAVFWNLLNPIVSVLFGFGYILVCDWPVGLASFCFASILISSGPQGFAARKSQEFGSKNAYALAEFQNAVSCQKVIRAYEIQRPLLHKFGQNMSILRSAQFSKDFWASIVQIYIESAMYIYVAVITASLAIRVHTGDLESGDFFGYVTMLSRISTPVTTLGGFMRVAISNASSLQRIDEIIIGLKDNEDSDNFDDSSLPDLPKMKGNMTLDNIVFRYDESMDHNVIDGLCANFAKGTYTCIVGPSGCGKTTLLSCILQFYEINSGTIRLDTLNIYNYNRRSFMDQIAVVFQDGGILNGTIYENIRYGNVGATDAECREAAAQAECQFIDDLSDGYDTVIGQHSRCNLSGGQVQRICLARALCRKPTILLLDEATSALDPETEASIVRLLQKLRHTMNMTIISVTHRLSTSVNADNILVLDHGKVAESGTYSELLRRPNGLFSEMVHDCENQQIEETSLKSSRSFNVPGPRRDRDSRVALENFSKTLSARITSERQLQNSNRTLLSSRRGLFNSHRTSYPDNDGSNRRSSLGRFSSGRRPTARQVPNNDENGNPRDSYLVL